MNIRFVLKLVGRIELIVAATMCLPLAVALLYGESPLPFLCSQAVMLCICLPLACLPAQPTFFQREGFATVGLIWIVTCLFGSLPFCFSGCFASFLDCLFEASSGFTTTGATILPDIEILPQGIQFWRCFTHWLGGMGVLVLATAVLPSLGVQSQYLTRAETPGPMVVKLVPKQAKTSKILYGIYCVMTVIVILLLFGAGMPLYDAVVHAFSIAGTGGFSSKNASFAAYTTPAVDLIVSVFTLLFSLNFGLFFLALRRRFREIWRSEELRFFLLVVTLATVLIAWDLTPVYHRGVLESLRYSFFHVTSVISTSGFFTEDYALWPHFSQMVLVLLMFCGSCSSSTVGGIKCARVLILLRLLRREVRRIAHPRCVEVIKMDGRVVESATARGTLVFLGCYVLILLAAGLIISLDGYSFSVSFSSALAGLSNVGPGLEMVGPTGNFSVLSPLSKVTMSLCMVIGRLEIFPVLVLFSRGVWRHT